MPLSFLSQYFAEPAWLLGLLGLIPLIAFYLIRPEPDEKVMPSMVFFMEDDNSGRAVNALKKLQKNFMLILHILLVSAFAVAMAGPELPDEPVSEHSVMVLDRSASMQPHFDEAVNFLEKNAGEENTLIVVDENVEVVLERGSPRQLKSELSEIRPNDLRTDTASGLQLARAYGGDIYLAGDRQQTVDDRSASEIVREIASERTVNFMDTSSGENYAITNVVVNDNNITVEVSNFRSSQENVELKIGSKNEDIHLDSLSSETVTFDVEPGSQAEIELGKGEQPHHKAYVSVPPEEKITVGIVGGKEDVELQTVFDVIPSTEVKLLENPLEGSPEVDMIIVDRLETFFETTENTLEKELNEGTPVVLKSQRSFLGNSPDFLSGELGGFKEGRSIEILEPVRTGAQDVSTFKYSNFSGESLSNPSGGLVLEEGYSGDLVFMNFVYDDFKFDILYPVYWKRITDRIVDIPEAEDLNVETGSYIQGDSIEGTEDDEIFVDEEGFYQVDGRVVAANLFDFEELKPVSAEELESEGESNEEGRNVQNLAILFLFLMLCTELLYLRRLGEL